MLRVVSSSIGRFGYALYNPSPWLRTPFSATSMVKSSHERFWLRGKLDNQPIWKVFTNCDSPSSYLITTFYRTYNMSCIFPCMGNGPTCSVSLTNPRLSICGVINRTHSLLKQTQLAHTMLRFYSFYDIN